MRNSDFYTDQGGDDMFSAFIDSVSERVAERICCRIEERLQQSQRSTQSSSLSVSADDPDQLIIEANKACNYPKSYMGASMLFALSTAIGNTCTLRVKRNRVERCILYLHLIGEPGSAKSHPLRFALQPIFDRDIKSRKEIDGDIMILATLLGDFLLASAKKTIDLMSHSTESNRQSYNAIFSRLPDVFTKAQANEVAQTLGFRDSIVDKFCKDMQGYTIIRLGHGQYQKISP